MFKRYIHKAFLNEKEEVSFIKLGAWTLGASITIATGGLPAVSAVFIGACLKGLTATLLTLGAKDKWDRWTETK